MLVLVLALVLVLVLVLALVLALVVLGKGGIAGLGIAFRAKPLVKANAKQAISNIGLDGVLYLMGIRDRESMLGQLEN